MSNPGIDLGDGTGNVRVRGRDRGRGKSRRRVDPNPRPNLGEPFHSCLKQTTGLNVRCNRYSYCYVCRYRY